MVAPLDGEKMTDQQLLSAYADARDLQSLGAFFDRYQGDLVRFALRMVADLPTAQDVVQEAFLRVARHPGRVLRAESCHNWLIRSVRNLCLARTPRTCGSRAIPEKTAGRPGVAAVVPPVPGDREAALASVRRAVGALQPRYREVILLKVQERKSYREIAEITGLSVTKVGHLLHHAMKALGPGELS